MTITLYNSYHQSEASVIVESGMISPKRLKAARQELCGMSDCQCGDIRGDQDVDIEICHSRYGEYARVFFKGKRWLHEKE